MTYTTAISPSVLRNNFPTLHAGDVYLADGTFLYLVPRVQTGTPDYYCYDLVAVDLNRTSTTVVVTDVLDMVARADTATSSLLPGICRDTAGGIYVAFGLAGTCHARYLTKGTGLTWTKGVVLSFTARAGLGGNVPVWCNTGGGTSGAGHVLVKKDARAYPDDSDAIVLDAGIVKQGSGSPLVSTAAGVFPDMYQDGGSQLLPNSDPGVVGATSGWWVHSGQDPITGSNKASKVGNWSVSSAGVATVTLFGDTLGSGDSPRLLRISSTLAIVASHLATTTTKVGFTGVTATGWVGSGFWNQTYGDGITGWVYSYGLPEYRIWDVAYDRAFNRIWVYGGSPDSTSSPYASTSLRRIGGVVNGVTGITWATTAATVEASGLEFYELQGPSATPPSSRWDWVIRKIDAAWSSITGGSTLFNQNPYAPTLTGPANGSAVDLALTQRLSFTFADPDIGDSLSKWDIQWSSNGGTSWTTVTRITTNAFWDADPATFPAGSITWHARTYDAAGAVGPYSADWVFTAGTTPGIPSITAPTSGSSIGAITATVTWSITTETDYQIRRVADVAGVADPTTIYYDSGDVVDSVTRLVVLAFPTNGRWEHIQVCGKDAGLWSAWADCRVFVNFDPPMTPTIILTAFSQYAEIDVAISNPTPTGSAPVCSYNDVFASSLLDPEIRIATQVLPNTTWPWKTPAAGRVYNIRAVAVSTTGTTASST